MLGNVQSNTITITNMTPSSKAFSGTVPSAGEERGGCKPVKITVAHPEGGPGPDYVAVVCLSE